MDYGRTSGRLERHSIPEKAGAIENGRRTRKVRETRKTRKRAPARKGRERWKVLEWLGGAST